MIKHILLITFCLFILTACQAPVTPPATSSPLEIATATSVPAGPATPGKAAALTVMTHDSFAVSEEVIAAFENEYQIKVQFIALGDTGAALNSAILAKGKPLADVFYGIDNTFLSRALDEGIFEAYHAPALAGIPAEFKLDPQNRAIPIDYGDICLNYDKAYFEEHQLSPPQTLEDLLKPEYKGLLVVEDPTKSSPGLGFLLATIGHFGEDGYLNFWQGLVANDLRVTNDWESAYYGEFTRAGGDRPIVLSYSSSPPFEVIYAEQPMDEPPTGIVAGAGACFRQVEFVGILKGAAHREQAEKWIDFMLSRTFQEDMPLQMYVFPVNPQAVLDETFVKYLTQPQEPAYVSSADIAAKREAWLQAWVNTVLR